MIDKVQKIREEVARIQLYTQSEVLKQVLDYIDKVQEEPVSGLDNGNMPIERWKKAVEAASNQRNYRCSKGLTETRDDYFVDGVQWADEHPKEESVSEDLEIELEKYIKGHFTIDTEQLDRFGIDVEDYMYSMDKSDMLALVEHFTNWQKTKEEPVSEDFEEEAVEAFKKIVDLDKDNFLEIFKAGAKWQKIKEELVGEDYRERYKNITRSDAFKSAYENKSLGEVMSVEGEEPVSDDILDVSRIDYRLQHKSIEDGIKYHAEEYSYNIESVLYNQLTGEQQKLWRKELERAVISGGYYVLGLSRDKRYKENQELVSEDLEEAINVYSEKERLRKAENEYRFFSPTDFASGFKAGARWQKEKDDQQSV